VLSVDEKSQIPNRSTARRRDCRRSEAAPGTMTHAYKRHGTTTTQFAALNVLDNTVIGRNMMSCDLIEPTACLRT